MVNGRRQPVGGSTSRLTLAVRFSAAENEKDANGSGAGGFAFFQEPFDFFGTGSGTDRVVR